MRTDVFLFVYRFMGVFPTRLRSPPRRDQNPHLPVPEISRKEVMPLKNL